MAARESFSEVVRRAILESDLSPAELARQSGLTEGALSRFIHGTRDFKLSTADQLADVLGLRMTVEPPARRPKRKGQTDGKRKHKP